jgi:Rieske Fe-S protein
VTSNGGRWKVEGRGEKERCRDRDRQKRGEERREEKETEHILLSAICSHSHCPVLWLRHLSTYG